MSLIGWRLCSLSISDCNDVESEGTVIVIALQIIVN